MVGLDVVVGVAVGAMPRRWGQFVQRDRVGRRLVGDDLHGRDLGDADGPFQEAAGCLGVALWGDEHVDDLAELVDRTVDVAPPTGDLCVALIGLPAVADGVAAGPGGIDQQRREPLDPAVDGGVVDLDPAVGEQLLDVAIGQPEAQVSANRQHDHLGWKAEAGEGRSCVRS
jgi:hypothetical protein